MKNKLLIFFLLLAGLVAHAQAVLRVNNTVGSAAPYTTIAAAVTAANVNDIIMVEGSSTGYGDITINKKVTIIGPGYFLAENLNLQASPHSASVNSITLNSGASGSSISGLTYVASFNALVINSVSNLSILNSYFITGVNIAAIVILNGTGNNLLISGNYFGFPNARVSCTSSSYTQVLLTNNYLGIVQTGFSTFTISNNVFGADVQDVSNSTVQNNIYLFYSNVFGPTVGSIIKNNVFVNAQTGVDATNLISQPLASLFLGLPGNTSDTQWRLKAGSPAIGAGVAGADCGMYGGTTPYRPSGIIAGQPTITNFVSPASVSQNGTLNMKVSAKVN